jgi:hypothetical protein
MDAPDGHKGATVAVGYNRGLSSAQQFVADLTRTTTCTGRPHRRIEAMSAPPPTAGAQSRR